VADISAGSGITMVVVVVVLVVVAIAVAVVVVGSCQWLLLQLARFQSLGRILLSLLDEEEEEDAGTNPVSVVFFWVSCGSW